MRYVVCYDIADDRRRKRVADLLDAYGDRIQNSVFEIAASGKVLEACLEEIEQSMELHEDRLAIFSLCSSCDRSARYFGVDADMPRTGEEKIFLV